MTHKGTTEVAWLDLHTYFIMKTVYFQLPDSPTEIPTSSFGEILRVLSAFKYTPLQAEHARVVLRGQTLPKTWANTMGTKRVPF